MGLSAEEGGQVVEPAVDLVGAGPEVVTPP